MTFIKQYDFCHTAFFSALFICRALFLWRGGRFFGQKQTRAHITLSAAGNRKIAEKAGGQQWNGYVKGNTPRH
jgi:hypothetical protein